MLASRGQLINCDAPSICNLQALQPDVAARHDSLQRWRIQPRASCSVVQRVDAMLQSQL